MEQYGDLFQVLKRQGLHIVFKDGILHFKTLKEMAPVIKALFGAI